jgi:hypothetical protein
LLSPDRILRKFGEAGILGFSRLNQVSIGGQEIQGRPGIKRVKNELKLCRSMAGQKQIPPRN